MNSINVIRPEKDGSPWKSALELNYDEFKFTSVEPSGRGPQGLVPVTSEKARGSSLTLSQEGSGGNSRRSEWFSFSCSDSFTCLAAPRTEDYQVWLLQRNVGTDRESSVTSFYICSAGVGRPAPISKDFWKIFVHGIHDTRIYQQEKTTGSSRREDNPARRKVSEDDVF